MSENQTEFSTEKKHGSFTKPKHSFKRNKPTQHISEPHRTNALRKHNKLRYADLCPKCNFNCIVTGGEIPPEDICPREVGLSRVELPNR